MVELSFWILLVLGGVLLLAFRTMRGVVLPVASIGVAVLWTVGVVAALGQSLNAVTSLVPPLLTALGLSYSVHVVSEYYDVARTTAGLGSRAIVGEAMRRVALPVILTGITTAAGFASLLLSPIEAVQQFGSIAVLGVIFTVISSLGIPPSILALLPLPARVTQRAARDGRLHRSIERIAHFDFRQRRAIFVVAAGIFAVSILGASQIRFGSQQISKFRPDAPVRVHFEAVNESLQGANPFYVVMESEAPKAFQEPLNLHVVEELQRWLESQPEIGGTTSMVDYLALLHRGFSEEEVSGIPESRRVVSQLFFFGASEDLERFVDSRFQATNITVRARVVDSDEVTALTRRVEEHLKSLPGHLVGTVTGTVVVLDRALDAIIRGQAASILAALFIIYGILSAMFVSLRVGLVALIPNVLPVAAFFGALGLTGIRLDTGTSLIAPMVLGIAVDDTIHYFSRFIRESKRLNDPERATVSALKTVGPPVTVTSLALCLGFLTLNASELSTQGDLGNMAAFTLAFAWLTDFFLTPALCARLHVATLWDLLSVDLGDEPHRAIRVFKGLRAAQARIVALMGTVIGLRSGERLFHAGEPGGAFYVVIDGELRTSVRHPDGSREIDSHERGDVLGEVGLFHGRRTADVDASQTSRLIRFTEGDLEQLARRYPRIAAVVHRNLNEVQAFRLARATRWLVGDEAPTTHPELDDRGRVLEDAFFRAEADRFRDQLVGDGEREGGASEEDHAVVQRLSELGIRSDTLAALTLIPLVEVAWADGEMDEREREIVLGAARSNGISADGAGFELLRVWLDERPDPHLFQAWHAYMEAITGALSVETRIRLKDTIVGRARAVAEAAGGFLSLAAVSRAEEEVLEALERAFRV